MSSQQDSSVILHACAFHRSDYDDLMIRSSPQETAEVLGLFKLPFESPSLFGLGDLEQLPAELITIMIRHLDLLSFFRFRHVNRKARMLCTELKEYRFITTHAMEGLRTLLRTQAAQNFTILDLRLTLVIPACELCGEFGAFLFLPRLTRCCVHCIQTAPELQMVSLVGLTYLTNETGTRLQMLLEAPMRTVPGVYAVGRKARRPRLLWVEHQARETLKSLGLCGIKTMSSARRRLMLEERTLMACTVFPWYNEETGELEGGVSCQGCRNRVNGVVGSLVEDLPARDRVFSNARFLMHFEHCQDAQDLWTERKKGEPVVP